MELQPDQLSSISAAYYRIAVVGYLDENMSARLNGLTIQNTEPLQTGKKSITILTGLLTDQAALLGVLNALYNMCLPLLAVECLNIDEPKGE